MITVEQYFQFYAEHPDVTPEKCSTAADMIDYHVNPLIDHLQQAGVEFKVNPGTDCFISGEKNGGFRPMDCAVGAPKSTHKMGTGVDVYDPHGDVDRYLDEHPEVQEMYGVYREHADATPGWCHLQSVPPGYYTGNPAPDRWVYKP